MKKFNVQIYREMRLVFQDIEAKTPEQAAATCRDFPADEACGPAGDCDGETFTALVDEQGDLDYSESVMIDFEAERMRKAASELLATLEISEGFISGFEDDELQAGINELLARVRNAISDAKALGLSESPARHARPCVLVEVSGGIAEVTATQGDAVAIVVDWDMMEGGSVDSARNYAESLIAEVEGSTLDKPVKDHLLTALEEAIAG